MSICITSECLGDIWIEVFHEKDFHSTEVENLLVQHSKNPQNRRSVIAPNFLKKMEKEKNSMEKAEINFLSPFSSVI